MAASASKQGAASSQPIVAPSEVDLSLESSESSESADHADRHSLIAEAAFFVAQERGFAPGQELDDWLAAEREVDQRLSATPH
ncbi:MAG: DUF2934 domain-containing protein [Rubrivivax sp.]|nr:DUF2934 domain-containing protein [Rubrivivax sp.]